MLDGGQPQPNNKPHLFKWASAGEGRLFALSVAGSLIALVVALVNSASTNLVTALVQFGVSLLVLGLIVWDYWLCLKTKNAKPDWSSLAWGIAALVIITGFFSGPFFNVMLAPLLIGLARRQDDQTKLLKLSLAAIGLTIVELPVFYLLQFSHNQPDPAGATLTALAATSLALASLMRRYQTEVSQYRQEAENKASEMEVAHEIQTSLMPPEAFTSGNWTLAARSLPARDVGGDFYEYVPHPHLDHTISGIAIGDVAGKGIPAALQMAVVRTLFRVEAKRRIFPGETLMSVNMALQTERSFGMVTMLYAFIDIASNTLHVANAGHNYPLVLNGTLEEIRLPGLPLGIDDSIEYEEKVIKITPGTSVIFYTDGVPEAMDTEGNLFTFERFKEIVQANKDLAPEEMVERLLKEIADFTSGAAQSDDITLLVLQYHPQPGTVEETPETGQPVGVVAEANRVAPLETDDEDDGINWI